MEQEKDILARLREWCMIPTFDAAQKELITLLPDAAMEIERLRAKEDSLYAILGSPSLPDRES